MVEDMPLTARGNGRVRHEVDAGGIAHLLRGHAGGIVHGVIEQVAAMPQQGVASMFSLGHSFGVATAALSCLGISFELLPAAKWKRLAEVSANKSLVLAAARRLWPSAPLTRAKDHGRAEALCMARLAMQRHRGH
jgi:crossover junction endodeoxyribonuclease RuvC